MIDHNSKQNHFLVNHTITYSTGQKRIEPYISNVIKHQQLTYSGFKATKMGSLIIFIDECINSNHSDDLVSSNPKIELT